MSPNLNRLVAGFDRFASQPAIIAPDETVTYKALAALRDQWLQRFRTAGVIAGEPVALATGFRIDAIAAFLALLELRAVAVLLAPDTPRLTDRCRDAGAARLYRFTASAVTEQTVNAESDSDSDSDTDPGSDHEPHALLTVLNNRGHAGFVVFSSGSSGSPKAVLHDAEAFCTHIAGVAKAKSTIALLALDHIAGVDTLLYTLFAGGSLILLEERSPEAVCQAIAANRGQVLPASPSFLKLLLLSRAWERYDLDSLEIITFGSEPPDPATSDALAKLLPSVSLLQKYGTSEFGAPRSRTREGDTSWIRIDGPNCEVRVIDDILWVRASGTMLGYLNQPAPTAEAGEGPGWLCTGDRVEQDGPWLRILGRDSDLISVGGEKVYPAEVERCIEALPEVLECAVSGEANELMGQIVVARVRLDPALPCANPKALIRKHARQHLPRYAVPVRVEVTDTVLTSERGKRLR